jgi:hypothetical protein
MKNMMWAAPGTIYGDAAGYEEPAARPFGAYSMFYNGHRQPATPAPEEKDPNSPRESGYRLPRILVDIVKARPIHLAIIDGIETQTAVETAAAPEDVKRTVKLVKPGVLLAGLNPVCTDAVAAAVMGLDPMADKGKAPFELCDSTLRLAEEAGIGTRDVSKIEVAGTPVAKLRFPFRGRA